MQQQEIYLDYAATSPVDPRVVEAMLACLDEQGDFANPSSAHAAGRRACRRVEEARLKIAERVHAQTEALIFTSGATEANNLALRGVLGRERRHLITARTEHKSVLDTARMLEAEGVRVTYLDCETDGRIDPGRVAAAIGPDTGLVSIMHVNNETGVIQDIARIAAHCRVRDVPMHVDAAQSVGKVPVDVREWDADLVSLTAHKVCGPKGIGALYVRPGVHLTPLICGGEQERGLRAGTLPTHQIVAMGEAYALADVETEGPRLDRLSARLRTGLASIAGVRFNGSEEHRAPHIVNAAFVGVEGESLRLAIADIAVSAGSACMSDSPEASHVLSSMGLGDALAASSLRFSVGRYTDEGEVDRAVARIEAEVTRLRTLAGAAPSWCSA